MFAAILLADATAHPQAFSPEAGFALGWNVLSTLTFGLIGIILAIIGFKLFDFLTPGNLEDEIIKKQNLAAAILGDLATRDAPFGELTTYRVGGRAALRVVVPDERALEVVASACRESGIAVLALGRGSNTLVADRGFDGLVVMLGDAFATVEIDGTSVRAG